MKKVRLIILMACMFSGIQMVMARPLYIYSSTRGILSFDSSDLISIDYVPSSDGNPSVQNFVTADTIYSVPVSDIDYVGFKTPETVYKKGVNFSSALSEYVINGDSVALYLNKSIPHVNLPQKGQVFFVGADGEKLRIPFIGRLNRVEEKQDVLALICDPAALTDVFEVYYGVSEGTETPRRAHREAPGRDLASSFNKYTPTPLSISISDMFNYEDDDDNPSPIEWDTSWDEIIAPTYHYKGYLIVDPKYGINLGVDIITDISVKDEISLAGSFSRNEDVKLFGIRKPIPSAFIEIYFEVGLTAMGRANVSAEMHNVHNYRHIFHYDWSSNSGRTLKPVSLLQMKGSNYEGYYTFDGSVSAGVYFETGIAFIGTSSIDVAKADVRFELGLKAQGRYVPSKRRSTDALTSTNYYDRAYESAIEAGIYTAGYAEFFLFNWSNTYDETIFKAANNFWPWSRVGVVPVFDKMNVSIENNKVEASSDIKGNCISADIGIAVVNNRTKEMQKVYKYYDYTGGGGFDGARITFHDSDSYTIYPLVKSLGVEMIARPYYVYYPVIGNYSCNYIGGAPNAVLTQMSLNEDLSVSQTYFYQNRGEDVTYTGTYERKDDYLILKKSNGAVQQWHIDMIDDHVIVLSQTDGFKYILSRM